MVSQFLRGKEENEYGTPTSSVFFMGLEGFAEGEYCLPRKEENKLELPFCGYSCRACDSDWKDTTHSVQAGLATHCFGFMFFRAPQAKWAPGVDANATNGLYLCGWC